jgi:hypothetical protein
MSPYIARTGFPYIAPRDFPDVKPPTIKKSILGVDPGINGGLCFFTPQGIYPYKMPTYSQKRSTRTMRFVDAKACEVLIRRHAPTTCYFENVFSMPGDTPMTAFSLGNSKGRLEAVLELCDVPIIPVSASVWKAKMGVTADKATSRKLAEKLMPHITFPTTDTCEAALIALYSILYSSSS